MPKLSTLNTWGRFFGLNIELEKSTSDGYSLKSASRFRLPPYQGYDNFFDGFFSPNNIDFLLPQKTSPLIKNHARVYFQDMFDPISGVKDISEELEKKVGVLEINFDKVTYTTPDGAFDKSINANEVVVDSRFNKLNNHFGITKSDLFNGINVSPVVADNSVGYMINLLLFKEFLGDFIDRGEIECDLLVITGELVWSGWSNLLNISEFLLNNISSHNQEVIIDFIGIWPMITRLGHEEPDLFLLKMDFFKPNLILLNDYLVDKADGGVVFEEGKNRKYYINEKKANLFRLDEKVNNKPKLLLINSGKLPKFDYNYSHAKLSTWWTYDEWESFLLPALKVPVFDKTLQMKTRIQFPKPDVLDIELDTIISKGQVIGKELHQPPLFIDYSGIDKLEEKLMCVDGQIVREGEEIIEVKAMGGLSDKSIKAPVTGKIDLSLISKKILIFRETKSNDVRAEFTGKFTSQSSEHIRVESESVNIFLTNFIGHLPGGRIVGRNDLTTDDSSKILFLKDISEYDLDFDAVQEYGVKVILFLTLDYDDLVYMLGKREVRLGLIDIGIIDQLGSSEEDEAILTLIRKYYKYYASIENNILKIPYQDENLFARPAKKNEVFNIKFAQRLLKGDQIKVISYFDSHHYARIENVEENVISASDNKALLTVKKDNVYKYASK